MKGTSKEGERNLKYCKVLWVLEECGMFLKTCSLPPQFLRGQPWRARSFKAVQKARAVGLVLSGCIFRGLVHLAGAFSLPLSVQ